MNKTMLKVKEVADLFDIEPETVYNKISRSTKHPFPIKPIRIGRAVRFLKKDVDAFIMSQQQED